MEQYWSQDPTEYSAKVKVLSPFLVLPTEDVICCNRTISMCYTCCSKNPDLTVFPCQSATVSSGARVAENTGEGQGS